MPEVAEISNLNSQILNLPHEKHNSPKEDSHKSRIEKITTWIVYFTLIFIIIEVVVIYVVGKLYTLLLDFNQTPFYGGYGGDDGVRPILGIYLVFIGSIIAVLISVVISYLLTKKIETHKSLTAKLQVQNYKRLFILISIFIILLLAFLGVYYWDTKTRKSEIIISSQNSNKQIIRLQFRDVYS